jgi:hypothetical protein
MKRDDILLLQSSYRSQAELLIVRAPNSRFVLSEQASGAALPVPAGSPIDLAVGPEEWPEAQTLCEIPWGKLEARLGMQRTV